MRQVLTIETEPEFLHELATARGDLDTRSEVVLVLPRPGGKVITTAKRFYPEGVFRIPSGGIHPGETPEQAFVREAMEETGLDVEPLARIAEMVLHCVAGGRLRRSHKLRYPRFAHHRPSASDRPGGAALRLRRG